MNNTVKRTISGAVIILVMLAGLLVGRYAFAILMLFIMVAMMHEFYTITMNGRYKFSRLLAMLAGIVFFMLIFFVQAGRLESEYITLSIVPVILIMCNSLYVKDKQDFGKFADLYTGLLYIAIPIAMSCIVVFRDGEFCGHVLLAFFIIIWSSDVGGFVFGSTLGRYFTKKLFPDVSPKKSWAGFWGGLACAVAAAIILKYNMLNFLSLWQAVLLGVVMNIAAVYGDLFESQWKRCYEVKDSGNIIPGHGGILDRFDSTLFAMPAGVLLMVLLGL